MAGHGGGFSLRCLRACSLSTRIFQKQPNILEFALDHSHCDQILHTGDRLERRQMTPIAKQFVVADPQ